MTTSIRSLLATVLFFPCWSTKSVAQTGCPLEVDRQIYTTRTINNQIFFAGLSKSESQWKLWRSDSIACRAYTQLSFKYIIDFNITNDTLFVISTGYQWKGQGHLNDSLYISWWRVSDNQADSIRVTSISRIHYDQIDELGFIAVTDNELTRSSFFVNASLQKLKFEVTGVPDKFYSLGRDSLVKVKDTAGNYFLYKPGGKTNLFPSGIRNVVTFRNGVIRVDSAGSSIYFRYINKDSVTRSPFTGWNYGEFINNKKYAITREADDFLIINSTDFKGIRIASNTIKTLIINPDRKVRSEILDDYYYKQMLDSQWYRYRILGAGPRLLGKFVSLTPLGGQYFLARKKGEATHRLYRVGNTTINKIVDQNGFSLILPDSIHSIINITPGDDKNFLIVGKASEWKAQKLSIHTNHAELKELDKGFIFQWKSRVRIDDVFLVTKSKNNFYKIFNMITGLQIRGNDLENLVRLEAIIPKPGSKNKYYARARTENELLIKLICLDITK